MSLITFLENCDGKFKLPLRQQKPPLVTWINKEFKHAIPCIERSEAHKGHEDQSVHAPRALT